MTTRATAQSPSEAIATRAVSSARSPSAPPIASPAQPAESSAKYTAIGRCPRSRRAIAHASAAATRNDKARATALIAPPPRR